jgi:type I restriction enzyme S subunit
MSNKADDKAMKPAAKRALVPKLRFSEFREAGEWTCASLGRLFSERQETGFANLPLLSLMDKEGIVPQEETNRKNNSSADKSKYLRVAPGDIAYNTMRMWEGRSAYVGIEGLISPAYTVCAPTAKINGVFFSYYFKTEALIAQFRRYSQGLVKDTLNLKYEAFSRIEVAYPVDEREQQKIADCLASLDELVRLEAQKLDTLKAHKKGLMQQLFPRDGKTLPQLRFPEFREAGEWEDVTLGSVAEFASGGTPSKDVPEYWGGEIPWISASSMYETSLYSSDLNITEQAVRDGARIAKQGTLLILVRGSMLYNRVPMGIAAIDVSFNQDVKALTIKNEINAVFLLYELFAYESQIPVDKTGIGAGKIETDALKKFSIYIPSSIEQQKIAACLASLDDLIAAQAQKLDALKAHKKGLMQQLFPSVDEVQG